jgi:hypothetical protein
MLVTSVWMLQLRPLLSSRPASCKQPRTLSLSKGTIGRSGFDKTCKLLAARRFMDSMSVAITATSLGSAFVAEKDKSAPALLPNAGDGWQTNAG